MNCYDMQAIGNLISERRKMLGLTQKQLADLINTSHKTVSKWETGYSFPDLAYQVELCKVLKITLEELHEGKINKKLRFHKKINKIIIYSLIFIIFLIIPTYIYLLNYYNKTYDSFKLYTIEEKIDDGFILQGRFIENHDHNIIILDYLISHKSEYRNSIIVVDLLCNDKIINHSNSSSINHTFISRECNTNSNWRYKIYINNKLSFEGQLSFSLNNGSNEKTDEFSNDGNDRIIKSFLNQGFIKRSDDEYVLEVNKKEKYVFYAFDNRIDYFYYSKDVYKLYEYYYYTDEIDAYSFLIKGKKKTMIEKFTYYYNNKKLDCKVGECPSYEDALKIINKFRNLLKREL